MTDKRKPPFDRAAKKALAEERAIEKRQGYVRIQGRGRCRACEDGAAESATAGQRGGG